MMTHIDRDDLALIALAEFDLTEAERGHLAECPQCALELISLQHTAAVGRSARHVSLTEPSAAVWAGIHATLGLSAAVGTSPLLRDFVRPADAAGAGDDVGDLLEGERETSAGVVSGAGSGIDAGIDSVVDAGIDTGEPPTVEPPVVRPSAAHPPVLPQSTATPGGDPAVADPPSTRPPASDSPAAMRPRRRRTARRRTGLRVLLAGAAAMVLVLGGFVAARWIDAMQQPATAPVTFEARLTPFPGWQASGSAEVEATPGGHREVVVDLTGLSVATAAAPLREVWLIKADASGLISIGLLDGNTGHFDIPDDVDLAQYPLVDVSAEPDNGNPAHSGNSIVRGELHAT
ncbi:anti-sigma factor [Cryobacterium sp. RTS3]|uniref:anti-sigma factor n=1 Tax=Cryobacterium sp. RTS3 TaxID=3048643 RepID=UPI002B2304CF|nr:anti-sigma factor [Cryobacterium sp. RTS3]MEA9999458.1 anti-sigma factor [Cryobacterium sp. RTS3]